MKLYINDDVRGCKMLYIGDSPSFVEIYTQVIEGNLCLLKKYYCGNDDYTIYFPENVLKVQNKKVYNAVCRMWNEYVYTLHV